MSELKTYPVWDAPTRWFHWINLLCVLGLLGVGLVILNGGALGITNPGKIALKTVHVWIGYVFAANLCWRLIWAFFGNRYARWSSLLPAGSGYWRALRDYLSAARAGQPQQFLGHNPLGRISVAVLLLLLTAQAITGLVLAGTDLFYPPLGGWVAKWIAAPGVEPATLVPYAKETYDAAAYASMRAFRTPYATLHLYSFYALCIVGAIHIAAVVITELRTGGAIVSAMFSGRKVMDRKPVDE